MGEYQPIENYGIVGDLRTIALVGIDGSIDFMCFPNFDSPSVFAALLDSEKGGFFKISAKDGQAKTKQIYLPDTNILQTRILLNDGIGEVTDFMPVATIFKKNLLIRRVNNIKGEITYKMRCAPRFNYARSRHKVEKRGDALFFTSEGEDGVALKLFSSQQMQIDERDGVAEFTLKPGESAVFILENLHQREMVVEEDYRKYVENSFIETMKYWKSWAAKSSYNGRWREMVIRSALVIKLLISCEHGSILAAPTFGLPEQIGDSKNWDYRYAWIRDASFAVYSLMRLGYKEEAEAFVQWIERLCASLEEGKPLNPFYGLDAEERFEEIKLEHLEGYKKSYPVMIGNAAYDQLQIDIYGEFMDSLYLYEKFVGEISYDTWKRLISQIEWVVKNWKEKDRGIWEIRGDPQEFLYSRVMSWVAIDRAMRIGERRSLPVPKEWGAVRDEIYSTVYESFWNDQCKAFPQFRGTSAMDASTLLMPLKRFISSNDPRWLSTLKRIEEELVVDCLVYRYKPEEAASFGLDKGGEGTFSACSFWYIECLSRAGFLRKAEVAFDKMLSFSNHLGLYSEQLGLRGEHLGNFPQVFTHLALISAAVDLNERLEV